MQNSKFASLYSTLCKSWVHRQEDHFYMQFLWYAFHAEITIQCYIKYPSRKCEVRKISIKAKNMVEDRKN